MFLRWSVPHLVESIPVDEVPVWLRSGDDVIRHSRHGGPLGVDLVTRSGSVNLTFEQKMLNVVIITKLQLTMCPGRFSSDMISTSARVFTKISLRWGKKCLRLSHREMRVLPAIVLIHYLRVILGLKSNVRCDFKMWNNSCFITVSVLEEAVQAVLELYSQYFHCENVRFGKP